MSDVSSSRSYARAGEKREREREGERQHAHVYIYIHTHTHRERERDAKRHRQKRRAQRKDWKTISSSKKARTNFIHVERCASTGPAGPARHAAKSRRKLSRAGHFLSRVVVVDAAKRAALDFLTLHTRVLVVMGVRSFVKVKNTIQKRERDKKKKKKTKKKEDLCSALLCSALFF